jgi:hypothetical protein
VACNSSLSMVNRKQPGVSTFSSDTPFQ